MRAKDTNDLAGRISDGDREAERDLFLNYGPKIQTMIRSRLRLKVSMQDIEDLYSDIRIAILERLREGGYNPAMGKNLGAFIAGIVANKTARYVRDVWKKERVKSELPEGLAAKSANPEDILIAGDREKVIRKCLGKLPQKYQTVLLLKYFQDMSRGEIAELMDLKPERVSERLNYAQKLIMACLKKYLFFQF